MREGICMRPSVQRSIYLRFGPGQMEERRRNMESPPPPAKRTNEEGRRIAQH